MSRSLALDIAEPTDQSALVAGLTAKLRQDAARLGKGGRLKPLRELTRHHGVSQVTIRNAIRRLEDEGILRSQVGRGTFVLKNFQVDGISAMRTVSILREDYPSQRIDEISRTLHRGIVDRGHKSLVVTYSDVRHAMDVLATSTVSDAYVLLAPAPMLSVEMLAFLRKRTSVVLLAGLVAFGVDVDVIGTDYNYSIKFALDHLTERGHTRIGFASGEPFSRISVRYDMFRLQMQSRGIPFSEDMAVLGQTRGGDWPTPQIRHRFDELLAAHRGKPLPFTALLVWSYASAAGILESCKEYGLSVPDDLSIVVADSPDLDVRYADVLTMVGRPSEQVTESLLARIDKRWQDAEMPYEVILEKPMLYDRGSVRSLC